MSNILLQMHHMAWPICHATRLLHPPWNLLHNILQYGLCTVHQRSGGLLADHKLECAGDVLRECFVGGQVLANTTSIDLLPIVLVFQLKQRQRLLSESPCQHCGLFWLDQNTGNMLGLSTNRSAGSGFEPLFHLNKNKSLFITNSFAGDFTLRHG